MIVMKGSVEQSVGETTVTMKAYEYEPMTPVSGRRGRRDLVYLEAGTLTGSRAGEEGAELMEISAPGAMRQKGTGTSNFMAVPSLMPNRVYDYYDIQFSEMFPGGFSRIINGKSFQLSFLRMAADASFQNSTHPEEQLTVVLRGSRTETVEGKTFGMDAGKCIYIPSNAIHGAEIGPTGCDVLDVFHPVRTDYTERMNASLDAYHAIIPKDEKIELVADGLKEGPGLLYIEGPSWVDGKLYFSTMHYDAHWNGDPSKSAFVEMDPDGTYRYKSYGEMETNGTFPLANGNLAVCDTFGHRVVEMDTEGRVVRVLADSCEGLRLDGPNDLAVDMKGGIYFTDPQILPEPYFQPGRSVLYRRPDGKVIRVVPVGELIKPNGLIMSPDCRTLYVNSTPENFMMAYDINDDGTLSNGRKFGSIMVTPEMLDKQSINPQVDGMTVDERGNVYITSIYGLQIFAPDGTYIGMVHFPQMPVNCCFGDRDGKTLYVTCNARVYRIRTNVKGAEYTLSKKR